MVVWTVGPGEQSSCSSFSTSGCTTKSIKLSVLLNAKKKRKKSIPVSVSPALLKDGTRKIKVLPTIPTIMVGRREQIILHLLTIPHQRALLPA